MEPTPGHNPRPQQPDEIHLPPDASERTPPASQPVSGQGSGQRPHRAPGTGRVTRSQQDAGGSATVGRGGGSGARERIGNPLAQPKSSGAAWLWLGLLMLMVPFAIKLLLVDLAASNVPGLIAVPKLELQKMEALHKVRAPIEDMRRDMFEAEDAEKTQELRDKISEAEEEAEPKIEAINERFDKKIRDARADIFSNGSSVLTWIQTSIWAKILLDLPRIAGTFIIVFASLQIVSRPSRDDGHLKVYAIVVSGIVLMASTVWAFAAYFS